MRRKRARSSNPNGAKIREGMDGAADTGPVENNNGKALPVSDESESRWIALQQRLVMDSGNRNRSGLNLDTKCKNRTIWVLNLFLELVIYAIDERAK